MPYLIGTDEAGYGPNLGPLVIAATVWRVSCEPGDCDLYKQLRRLVTRKTNGQPTKRWTIADSKEVYKAGQGLRTLERNVLAAVAAMQKSVDTCRALWQALDPHAFEQFDGLPWHETHMASLPLEEEVTEIAKLGEYIQRGLQQAGVELVAIGATAIFPARFNALVDQYGSKGEALSRATLQLIGRVLEQCDCEPTIISCDKHGGRGKYQRLLQEQFTDPLIEVVCEGLLESIYRWGPSTARFEARFRAKGETFLPTALASMTAKYLRELAMHAFNGYWQKQVDGLKPTAGYPTDARRFKLDIASVQASLGIDDRILWRCR
jgi:ribonuclease HII